MLIAPPRWRQDPGLNKSALEMQLEERNKWLRQLDAIFGPKNMEISEKKRLAAEYTTLEDYLKAVERGEEK